MSRTPDYVAPTPAKLVIHLTNGRELSTQIAEVTNDQELYRLIQGPPRWQRLGGYIVYTQNIAALELG